jgi:hypothetical protein
MDNGISLLYHKILLKNALKAVKHKKTQINIKMAFKGTTIILFSRFRGVLSLFYH